MSLLKNFAAAGRTGPSIAVRLFPWLLAVLFTTAATGSGAGPASAQEIAGNSAERPQPPNIIFLLADDQTSSVLGCYGHPIVQTPHLDALASRGTRFQNSFVSQPICWVSRTTLLTGRVGRSYGTPENPEQTRPDAAETLYSDLLRTAGYRTGFFGKWHAKMPNGYQPARHFDEFTEVTRNPYFKRLPDGSLRHETDLIVDHGIKFLQDHPKDRPFALNLWFNACHAEDGDRRPGIGHFPWPQSTDELYTDVVMPVPRLNDPGIFEQLPSFLQTSITRERYFWRWNTEDKYETNLRAYFRMASGIDSAVGRLLTALEEYGLSENTIIVYSADNGYLMANRGLAGKWSHFDESLRVPLIIVDPRVPREQQGQVTDAMVLNADLPATFLQWAGLPVPSAFQGRSLDGIVSGKSPPDTDWRQDTFHEHFAVRNRIPAWEGIRTGRFKYARYFDHGPYEFLHDLQQDPDELVNLADNPAFAATLHELRDRTSAVVQSYGGPLAPMSGPFQESTVPHPEASAAVTVKPGPDGWVKLFNGRNLNGWDGDPQFWSVEDGAITGRTDGTLKTNRFLTWTGSTIRNFELQVEVKVTRGGNSGIQYRGTSRPELGLDIVSGYQCDVVADNPLYNGMLYEERGRRILSHTGEKVVVAADGKPWIVGRFDVPEFQPDEWHTFRVLAEGNHLQHWIDGHQTADLMDFDEAGRKLEGVLAVQVHVGPAMVIQYRNFKIRHLPDDLPLLKPGDHPIPPGSPGVRPQGRLPKNWTPPIFSSISRRPNFLLILTDDHGYGDVSTYHASDVRTPNIDSIARDGMLFTNMRANATVCSPSRAALLTGRYAHRVGVPGVIRTHPENSWGYFDPSVPTLADELRRGGYHTGIVGKWHLGLESPSTPNERGFDFFHGFLGDMMDSYTTHLRHGQNYMRLNDQPIEPTGHATELFTDWTLEYLRDRADQPDQPFFLYLAYNAPHFPIEPPAEWLDRVRARSPHLNDKRAASVAFAEHLDHHIGRVLEALKQTGLDQTTVVAFTADNGGSLPHGQNNDPWRDGKQSHYDGGLRVPFMIRWPGQIAAGSTSDYAGLSFDLFPTFLELADLPISDELDAVSLAPLFRGQPLTVLRDLFFVRREGGPAYGGKSYEAIIRGDWKLLQNDPYSPLELYHLREDPQEQHNVIAQNPRIAGELGTALRESIRRGGSTPWQRHQPQ